MVTDSLTRIFSGIIILQRCKSSIRYINHQWQSIVVLRASTGHATSELLIIMVFPVQVSNLQIDHNTR